MSEVKTPKKNLPEHWAPWAKKLAELYFSGTTAMFILHGNVSDLYAMAESKFGSLSEFLSAELFGRWDMVLNYDLARGLRPLGGSDSARQLAMVGLFTRRLAEPRLLPRDATTVLSLLDRFVNEQLSCEPKDQLSTAIIIDYASFVVPAGDRGAGNSAQHLVTLLNWASNPYIKRANIAFILIDSRLSDVHERLSSSAHVASLELTLPDEAARALRLKHLTSISDISSYSD